MLKTILMFGVASAALVGTQAYAAVFSYTGTEQSYTVQQTGLYDLFAAGAQGGASGSLLYGNPGLGAQLKGQVVLQAGSNLDIFVGGQGGSTIVGTITAGGGGGTFVFLEPTGGGPFDAAAALIVAGGGGGGGVGSLGSGLNSTNFGGDGQGGASGSYYFKGVGTQNYGAGAGGGGVRSSGGSAPGYVTAYGGQSPAAGAQGGSGLGTSGGFGGGGAGGGLGGGGGGGYTGGTGGSERNGLGGYGGTSYLRDGVMEIGDLTGNQKGNGQFQLDFEHSVVSAAPEPATWLEILMGVGVSGLLLRRRRPAGMLRTA